MKPTSQEQQILIALRQTLTAVIREITPPPGMRYPLSEQTVEDVRQCFALIAAREKELADTAGRCEERPYYADSPPRSQVVPLSSIRKRIKEE